MKHPLTSGRGSRAGRIGIALAMLAAGLTVGLATPATAEPVTSHIDSPMSTTPSTLDNGVTWSYSGPAAITCNTTATFTFDHPVDIVFGVNGLNAPSPNGPEGVIVPDDATAVEISSHHAWYPDQHLVTRTDDNQTATSTFAMTGITEFTVTGSGGCGWSRNIPFIDVTYDTNDAPSASIDGPADGATYFEGQQVAADYSCSDPDGTVASCEGTVPDGQNIDTSSTGSKDFSVTATDDEGATTTKTVTYKVVAVNGVCRGNVLGLPLGINLVTANGPLSPCATDKDSVVNLNSVIGNPAPLAILNNTIQAGVLDAHSLRGPGLAAADAEVASVGVKVPSLALNLGLTALKTTASSQLTSCDKPAQLTSSSTVGSLKLNGIAIPVGNQPLTVPLLVGALHLNQNAVSGNTVTRRAVFLDLPGDLLDVKIAESTAGAVCAS